MAGQLQALGMIETQGIPALIAAADAAAKTADVRVTTYEKADAGIVTVYILGDVSAVKAAVEAGEAEARKIGKLLSAHVIPRPDVSLSSLIEKPVRKEAERPHLEKLTLLELRRLARSTPGFPLSRPEINKAGKAKMLRLFMEMKE